MLEVLNVYCDGGCRGNQSKINVGGWGVYFQYGTKEKEMYGATTNTTNNVMELTACIKALEALDKAKAYHVPISMNCDSAYVCNGMNDWIKGWKMKGWKKSNKKPVENKDLWIRLDELTSLFSDISYCKVEGHSTNYGNNKADELVNIAMDGLARIL